MNIPAFVDVNHSAIALTCSYAAIALWPFFKKKKKVAGRPPSKVNDTLFHLNNFFLKKNDKVDKISKYFFDEKEIAKTDVAINKLMADKKPFLRKKYSVLDLATDVDVPVLYLSGFINRYYKMNFNELINKYRVSYFKMMIEKGEWENKKLAAIASEAGYNNRNTFIASFKKETGQTPSDYLKEVKQDRNNNRSLLDGIKRQKFA